MTNRLSAALDALHSSLIAAPTEQDLIRQLFEATRRLTKLYGSQNAAARAIGISASTLTRASQGHNRAYCADDNLPRPQIPTLRKFASCDDLSLQAIAMELLRRRGVDIAAK